MTYSTFNNKRSVSQENLVVKLNNDIYFKVPLISASLGETVLILRKV